MRVIAIFAKCKKKEEDTKNLFKSLITRILGIVRFLMDLITTQWIKAPYFILQLFIYMCSNFRRGITRTHLKSLVSTAKNTKPQK